MKPWGEPFGFIGATDVRKPTVRLDLRTYHDLPECPATRSTHAISIRSLEKLAGCFTFPNGSQLITSKKDMDQKHLNGLPRPRSLKDWPIDGFDNPSRHL